MKATETSLSFLNGDMEQFIIPFFQRPYVWQEQNWERLLDSLKNDNSSHFLGSIIVKNEARKNEDGFYTYSVIDGQQRITTLSIMMRALMDALNSPTVTEKISGMIFCKKDSIEPHSATNSVVKLVPGFRDKDVFTQLVSNPILAKQKNENNRLIDCYNYFFDNFSNDINSAKSIYRLICDTNIKFIVKIELEINDNEQAIFDVSNGTGVILTCADIIKNDLFLHIEENDRLDTYKNSWQIIFDSEDNSKFWDTIYGQRTNIEHLLFSVAQIEKNGNDAIFDSNVDTFDMLSKKYKLYFDSLSTNDIVSFVNRLKKYANIYKNNLTINETQLFSEEDFIPRYMLSFKRLSANTVLYPYILKFLYDICDDDGNVIDSQKNNLLEFFKKIERLLVRASIAINAEYSNKKDRPSFKNFNKSVTKVLNSNEPRDLFTAEQLASIDNDDIIRSGLKSIDNTTASIVLFLINLKMVEQLGKSVNVHEYAYNYELEHIMPQEFNTYWGVPEKDINGNNFVAPTTPEEYRKKYVYQIGNMTIITPKANKSIKNYDIQTKMNGDTTRTTKNGIRQGYKGYQLCANEPISSEFKTAIIKANYNWDEKMISDRTEELTNTILQIWN